MSKTHALLAALFTCVLAVSGCASNNDSPQSPSETTVPTSASTTTQTPTTTTTTTTTGLPPPPAPPPEPVVTPAPVAITFECGDPTMYEYGTALYSDGTTGYEPTCDTPPADRVLRYCDYGGVAIYTDGSYSTTDPACLQPAPAPSGGDTGYPYDPSQDRNGDGVVNGYERCGTACGEAPTSGETQMQYGCEEGWIDRQTCAQAGY
ncbi:hypothetical protein [Rhodococcus chondri]|uniref:Lipoprotein n=1 Tax=Rhodococcus chondri TaxID=3065941 RepID=A0ABU7JXP4_9NOCA|nr:hypothetical protein [Rhodococcus sp. CC-R104]MEE2034791.1 hypothetical protein [Rhodococcus sp. CC-R104]